MKIFISYRRTDAPDAAGRIFDRLKTAFGEGNIFKDVDSIPIGADFEEVIAERMSDCEAVIVIIGQSWATASRLDGVGRLHDPADFVRIEIEQALSRRIPLVPTLVGNANMPVPDQLPESIRKLTRRNAISIRPDPDFHRDMDRLIQALQKNRELEAIAPNTGPPVNQQATTQANIPRLDLSLKSSLAVFACLFVANIVVFLVLVGMQVGFDPFVFPKVALHAALYGIGQAGFVFTAGTADLLTPIRLRRRWAPVLICAFLILMMALGLISCLHDAFEPHQGSMEIDSAFDLRQKHFTTAAWIVKSIFGFSWLVWIVVFVTYSARWSRLMFFKRISQHFFAGCVLVLIVSIPSYFYAVTYNKAGWVSFADITSEIAIIDAIWLALFACGPGVIWLKMRQVVRKNDSVASVEQIA